MKNLKTATLVLFLLLLQTHNVYSQGLGTLAPPPAANVDLTTFIGSIITFAITSGVVVFFLMFMWGAIEWLISEGEKGRLAQARGRMTNAAIGLILLGSAYAILSIVQGLTYTP